MCREISATEIDARVGQSNRACSVFEFHDVKLSPRAQAHLCGRDAGIVLPAYI